MNPALHYVPLWFRVVELIVVVLVAYLIDRHYKRT